MTVTPTTSVVKTPTAAAVASPFPPINSEHNWSTPKRRRLGYDIDNTTAQITQNTIESPLIERGQNVPLNNDSNKPIRSHESNQSRGDFNTALSVTTGTIELVTTLPTVNQLPQAPPLVPIEQTPERHINIIKTEIHEYP